MRPAIIFEGAAHPAGVGKGTDIHTFSNTPDWLVETFFCMPHWPVTRGLQTCNVRSIADTRLRPTHASLFNLYDQPREKTGEHSVWAHLIGIAPGQEDELRALVRGWHHPPPLQVHAWPSAPVEAAYDVYERAYRIEKAATSTYLMRLAASEEHPQVRPAIIFEGAAHPAGVQVRLDNRALVEGEDFVWGFEKGEGVVVWLKKWFRDRVSIEVRFTS